MRFTIGKKLGLAIGGLLALFVLIGVVSLHTSRLVRENIQTYAREKAPLLELSNLITIDLLESNYWLVAYLYDLDREHLEEMGKYNRLFVEHVNRYLAHEKNPDGIKLVRKIDRARLELAELADKLISTEERQLELLAGINKKMAAFEAMIDIQLHAAISPGTPQAVDWMHKTMTAICMSNSIGGRMGIYLKTHEKKYAQEAEKAAGALLHAVDSIMAMAGKMEWQGSISPEQLVQLKQLALAVQTDLNAIVSMEAIKHDLILSSEKLVGDTDDILDDVLQAMAKKGVQTAMASVMEASDNATKTVGFTVVVALCFGILLGVVISFNLSRPIKHLVKATQKVAGGDFSSPVHIRTGDEIGDLGAAFAQMARSLGEFVAQRNKSEAKFRTMLELAVSGIIMIDTRGIIQMVNPAAERMLGYEKAELVGKEINMLMPDRTARHHHHYLQNFLETGIKKIMGTSRELAAKHRDGSLIPVELAVSEIKLEDEHLFLGLLADISARKAYEEQLKLLASVFQNTIEGIFITDRNGTIERVNPGFTRITGYSAEEAVGQNPRLLKSDRHDRAFYRHMWESIVQTGTWQGEIWNRKKNGEVFPEWQSVTSILDDNLEVTHYVAVFHDISAIKDGQEKLQYQANHDVLTDLPNRNLFIDRLEQAIASARRSGDHLAVLFLDLDKFKDINDTLGHHVGDQVLQTVARRLKSSCRDEDTVARLGGDEFMVLLPRQSDVRNIAAVAKRINETLIEPMDLGGQEIYAGASVGISLFPEDGDDAATLMKNSDMAMYRTKAGGRNSYTLYTQSMNEALSRRTALEADLRQAMAKDEFQAYFQPIIDTGSLKILGVEALMRWHRRQEEFVPPDEFIPLAEDFGLIHDMGLWMLEASCRAGRQWLAAGFDHLGLSVNLSRIQLQDKALPDAVEQILEQTQFDPKKLCLEITENIVMKEMEKALAAMDRFRALGINMVMDDFGTGYSSLGQLKELPLRAIKIDKSFIRDFPDDDRSTALVEATISMGKSLGLNVVAEGVETKAQLAKLRTFGCDSLQGYLFAKPMPAEELSALLQSNQGCFSLKGC